MCWLQIITVLIMNQVTAVYTVIIVTFLSKNVITKTLVWVLCSKMHFFRRERERPSRCVYQNCIICTVNTQHTSRQDATITVRLYWLHVSAVIGRLQAK